MTQLVQKLVAEARQAQQARRHATELHAAQTKIQALALELAHLKRMRFGVKSEALDAEMRDLFQETLEADIAAAKLDLDRRQADATPAPPTSRPANAPAARRFLTTCHASSIGTSRTPAPAASAAATWSRSARTSASNSTSSRRASSSIATSVRSMPAAPARP